MVAHENASMARLRPARPIAVGAGRVAHRLGEGRGQVGDEPVWVDGDAVPSCICSIGTSQPVSPCTTTSGIPPVAVATTGSSQAIASRLTMPSGS